MHFVNIIQITIFSLFLSLNAHANSPLNDIRCTIGKPEEVLDTMVINIIPSSPHENQLATVVIKGINGSCQTPLPKTVTYNQSEVIITAFEPTPRPGISCPLVIVPYQCEVDLKGLNTTGDYTVTYQLVDKAKPSEAARILASKNFTVTSNNIHQIPTLSLSAIMALSISILFLARAFSNRRSNRLSA